MEVISALMLMILSGMQLPIFASTNGLGYVRLLVLNLFIINDSVCNNYAFFNFYLRMLFGWVTAKSCTIGYGSMAGQSHAVEWFG